MAHPGSPPRGVGARVYSQLWPRGWPFAPALSSSLRSCRTSNLHPVTSFPQTLPCPARPCPCVLLSPHPCPCPLLTCSPARHLAATPWWTAPSAPTGLRSLVGPSEGGSHTTAAGREGPGPCCLLYHTPGAEAQPRGHRRGGTLGPCGGGPDRGKEGDRVISYHLYPNVGGKGLLSLILGV